MTDDAPEFPPVPGDGEIRYFDRDRDAFGFLSHFWPSPIELDHHHWPTVEHYYQAQKSPSHRYQTAVRLAATPGVAKRLAARPEAGGRAGKISWFKANDQQPRADWHEAKLDIMRRADRAKYAQHPELAARLLATGNARLIEDSPGEPFWGTGPDGNGLNWAGRVLEEVRAGLREQANVDAGDG